jgi:capsular exopolysaccharide synthesis family protein
VALAQTGKRTLLVSGDLRAPRLSKLLGVENTWGLVDVLRRGAALQEVAQTAYDDRLKILNSGPLPASPVELLQSPRLHEFLLEQRAAFDFVIVDCSPVLGLADALAVAPVVDGIILVASGTSKQGAIAEARAELDQVGGRVVGSVLNDIPVKRLRTKAYGYGATAYRYTASDSDETRVVGASGNGNGNGEPVAAGRRSRSKE